MLKHQMDAFNEITVELFTLCDSKSKDYSDELVRRYKEDNISKLGLRGIYVRMDDKMGRLYKMIWLGKKNAVKTEVLEDALKDLAIYSIIALMLKRKQWKMPLKRKQWKMPRKS